MCVWVYVCVYVWVVSLSQPVGVFMPIAHHYGNIFCSLSRNNTSWVYFLDLYIVFVSVFHSVLISNAQNRLVCNLSVIVISIFFSTEFANEPRQKKLHLIGANKYSSDCVSMFLRGMFLNRSRTLMRQFRAKIQIIVFVWLNIEKKHRNFQMDEQWDRNWHAPHQVLTQSHFTFNGLKCNAQRLYINGVYRSVFFFFSSYSIICHVE